MTGWTARRSCGASGQTKKKSEIGNIITGGDEVIGMSRAFLYAGASSVMASLWEVDDRATTHFMGEFYRELASGPSKVTALRKAQLLTMKKYREPLFWASFIMLGRDD